MQNAKNFPQNTVHSPKAGDAKPMQNAIPMQNKGNFPQSRELGPEDGKN